MIRLAENAEAGKIPSTLSDEIKQQLFQEKFREEISRYLTDELPKKYNVELRF